MLCVKSILVVTFVLCQYVLATALYSVDLGTDFMKIALFSQRFPVDIALNYESQRKTVSSIGFRNSEHFFGSTARTSSIKFPETSVEYFVPLLGKKYASAEVDYFIKSFPYMTLQENPLDGTVDFMVNQEVYTVVELVGLLLDHAHDLAANYAMEEASHGVITVPSYFDENQVKAMLYAADAAQLNVSQVVKNNVAVAVSYGTFQVPRNADTKPLNVLFIDMGCSGTSATLVNYTVVKDKSKQRLISIKIKANEFDSSLGGLQFDLRLKELFIGKFEEASGISLTNNHRAHSKLLKQAIRTKEILSANAETVVFVDNLIPGKDFKLKVTRAEFEKLCEDLFARFQVPITRLLNQHSLSEIDQIVLFGGAQRIPRVQSILRDVFTGKEISKIINQDEAAATGAVLLARNNVIYSHLFYLKDETKEAFKVALPSSDPKAIDSVKEKVLSKKKDSKNATMKELTVYTTSDFSLEFKKEQSNELVTSLVTTDLASMIAELDTFTYLGTTIFTEIDRNGFFHVSKIMAKFEEKLVEPIEEEGAKETSAEEISTEETSSKETSSEETTTKDTLTDDTLTDDTVTDNTVTEDEVKAGDAIDAKPEKASVKVKKPVVAKKSKRVVQLNIKYTQTNSSIEIVMTADALHASTEKLSTLKDQATLRLKTQEARNILESLIYETKEHLDENEIKENSTSEELEAVASLLSVYDTWIYEEAEKAPLDEYQQRISSIRELMDPIHNRIYLIHNPLPPAEIIVEEEVELEKVDEKENEDNIVILDDKVEDELVKETVDEPEPVGRHHADDL